MYDIKIYPFVKFSIQILFLKASESSVPGKNTADSKDVLREKEEQISSEYRDGHLNLFVRFLQRTICTSQPSNDR